MSEQSNILWDLPTRLFHWSLVAGITTCWVTGSLLSNAMPIHVLAGYFTLSLLLFRLLWGFGGSETSRFSHFLRGPLEVMQYAKTLLVRDTRQHAGHNPVGGWSVLLLLASSVAVAVTGLFANDEVDTRGPLADRVGDDLSDRFTDWHHQSFDILAILIGLHLFAILFYRFYKKADLVTPMITGKLENCQDCNTRQASVMRAALFYGVCVAAIVGMVQSAH